MQQGGDGLWWRNRAKRGAMLVMVVGRMGAKREQSGFCKMGLKGTKMGAGSRMVFGGRKGQKSEKGR